MSAPWDAGLPPNLIPNPPGEIPAAQGPGDAVKSLSPFSEPQDVDSIIAALMLDRPLKLYVPKQDQYPQWSFRIINNIPTEIADAHNKGWKEVTDPELAGLFTDLVAGTDKTGKAYRPMLMARPKAVSTHIEKQHRRQLQSLYAGMDPKNKEFQSGYAKNAGAIGGSEAEFKGPTWRIRV